MGEAGQDGLAFTWWGHATTTVELGPVRVVLDPVLADRLFHLRRYAATPPDEVLAADVVLISHLHHDHLHVPSLRRYATDVPIVVPQGAKRFLRGVGLDRVVSVKPGDAIDVGGLRIEVLPATHDGRRSPMSQTGGVALGFRVEANGSSFWFPGDTGPRADFADVAPVDLAVAPVGGWGPTLGGDHLDPVEAAEAVRQVGARWAVPVHWGTFWPRGLAGVKPALHEKLFITPGPRFVEALAEHAPQTRAVLAGHHDRVQLD
jgi:L-ascorbate metabolism protein UlaG (beta-lactamase superfamily)